ncbi:MAG: hypothetical protein ACFFDT_35180 [Candidatus Hodarchaeota archaeon]
MPSVAYAVYVISMDGRPLVSEKFQSAESIPNETLLAGLFTAIQGVASEISKKQSEINNIKINNLSYHFKSFGKYQIVLVTDLSKTPENVLQKLGLRFMKEHGEKLLEGISDQTVFEPFINTINEVVREEFFTDDLKLINPTKKFSPVEIYHLPTYLQSTALAMITLKEGSVEQIATESGSNLRDTEQYLQVLQKMGLIGRKITEDGSIYFCSF